MSAVGTTLLQSPECNGGKARNGTLGKHISVLKAVFEKVKGEVLPSASPSVYNQRCLR